jgi:hypothetical protein
VRTKGNGTAAAARKGRERRGERKAIYVGCISRRRGIQQGLEDSSTFSSSLPIR